jgi:hypothetical protein
MLFIWQNTSGGIARIQQNIFLYGTNKSFQITFVEMFSYVAKHASPISHDSRKKTVWCKVYVIIIIIVIIIVINSFCNCNSLMLT